MRSDLCKVRRSAPRKTIQIQRLMRTVLNRRSQEVWRQTGREREFRPRWNKCGAELRPYSLRLLGVYAGQNPAENVGRGRSGGGRGAGIQPSPVKQRPPAITISNSATFSFI